MDRTIKARLAAGDILFGAMINMTNPTMVELCCGAGADFVILEFEHGLRDFSQIEYALITAEMCGIPALVRIGERSANLVGRILDAGASGIVFPHVTDAEQARELVGWCRYKPAGARGSGMSRGYLRHAGHESDRRRKANDDVVCLMIVEDLAGASNLASILTVDGVTGVAIGPGDLSMELGADNWDDPRVTALLDEMAQVVRGHTNRALLRLCLKANDLPDIVASGANMILTTHDTHLVKDMYSNLFGQLRSALPIT